MLFGDVPASSVTLHSATRMTVVTPAHAPGGYDVRVVNRNGISPVVDADAFTFVAPVDAAPPSPVTPVAPLVSVASCTVPDLEGAKVNKARRQLKRAHCTLGDVTPAGKRKGKRVAGQSHEAGATLPAGTAVDVTLAARKG